MKSGKKAEKDIAQQIQGLKSKFSQLFSPGKKTSVGVDIGSKSIKIIELENRKGKLNLKNYAFVRTEKKLLKIGVSGIINNIAGDLAVKAMAEAKIKTKGINVAVPGFTSLITTIEVPDVSDQEVDRIIQEEVPKYIPLKLSEVVYGWEIIEGKAGALANKEKKTKRALMVAIMKDISNQYQKIFAQRGLAIDSLEIDSFSLVRSLVGNSAGSYLLIDIGHKVSNLIVIANGSILISRTVDIAGERIDQVIQKGMGVDEIRAEKLKLEQGLQLGADKGQQLLAPTISLLVAEIGKTLDLVKSDYPNLAMDKVILSGGTARMAGFRDYLEKELGVSTVIGNPLATLNYPKKLERILMNNSPFLSVAIGLAMLGFEEGNKK